MKTYAVEVIDLALSQSIERYMEMKPDEIYDAIVSEWTEQIAVLLIGFFFKTGCGRCTCLPDIVPVKRDEHDSHFYVAFCNCHLRTPFGGH